MTKETNNTKSKKSSSVKGENPPTKKSSSKSKSPEVSKDQRAPTRDDALSVLSLIEEEGLSFSAACKKVKVHRPSTWSIIHTDKALDDRYARAREERGALFGEKVVEISLGTLDGKHDPQAARVAMDGLKWAAGKMAPRQFGDKVSHEHGGIGGGAIKHESTILTPSQMAALSEDQIKAMMEIGKILFPTGQTGESSNEK